MCSNFALIFVLCSFDLHVFYVPLYKPRKRQTEFSKVCLSVYLQSTSLNNSSFNFVQFLQEIASEQQFEVTYVDIEEKSITGNSAGTSS